MILLTYVLTYLYSKESVPEQMERNELTGNQLNQFT